MSRGRKPEWAEAVGRLEGSAVAKARLRAVLEALTGRRTLAEVCLELGLSERRVRGLRDRMLQAALAGLEPRPAGRPAPPAGGPRRRVAELEAVVRDLRLDLRAAQVREEIALVMPQLLHRAGRAKGAGARKRARPRADGKSGASKGCVPSDRRADRRTRADAGGRPDSAQAARGSGPSGSAPWPSAGGRLAWGCPCPRPPPAWASRPGPWSAGRRGGAATGCGPAGGAGQPAARPGSCGTGRWR
jgi:hypothetical protein